LRKVGTNPEELVAAAHSGCLRCNFRLILPKRVSEIESIETKCDIDLVDGAVISSHLTVNAKIKGISDDAFQQQVTKAEKSPISKITDCRDFYNRHIVIEKKFEINKKKLHYVNRPFLIKLITKTDAIVYSFVLSVI
jgi:uncharacterized OsmC-like protein